jgi:hypothetical protein
MDETTAKRNEQVAILLQSFARVCEYSIAAGLPIASVRGLVDTSEDRVASHWSTDKRAQATADLSNADLNPQIFQDTFVVEARQVWASRRP